MSRYSLETIQKMRFAKLGKKRSLKIRKAMSIRMTKNPLKHWEGRKRLEMTGSKHFAWKEKGYGYATIHKWVNSVMGKPNKCEHCQSTTAKKFEWANITHSYRRNTQDWIRLCTKCHRIYDMRFNNYKKK